MLVFEYIRVGNNIPEAPNLANHYCIGFGLAALLWAFSIFLPSPWIYVIWAIALIIDLLTPITAGEKHFKLPPNETHLLKDSGFLSLF